MFAAIVAVTLSQWGPEPSPGMQQYDPGSVCERTGGRCFLNRSGNRPRENYAFFEFAPATNAGLTSACAGTAIASANGTAVSIARTGVATCAPLGNATSGITNASLVEVGANLPRVEVSNGNTSLRVEAAATNILPRFIDYANVAWADVATPTLTGAQVSPWTGTYANLAVQFDDNDAVAFEGRTQTVTTVALSVYTMSCYAKAGTLTSARLSLDGTTADFTGLSSTTWSLLSVTDASASGVAVAAQALNGSTAAATGTVIWGGCQVELNSQVTRMIPTVAASATRNVETPSVTLPVAMTGGTFCVAATVDITGSPTTGLAYSFVEPSQNVASGHVVLGYVFNGSRRVDLVGSAVRQNQVVGTTPPFGSGLTRYVSRFDGSTLEFYENASLIDSDTGAVITVNPFGFIYIGADNASGGQLNGNISRVQVDPSPSRCAL